MSKTLLPKGFLEKNINLNINEIFSIKQTARNKAIKRLFGRCDQCRY